MLAKERFYSFLLKKNISIIFITIFFIGYFGSLKAIEKISIINNFNSSETLKFDFTQKSFDKNEKLLVNKEKGVGFSSPKSSTVLFQSILDLSNLGGVPVFSRIVFKPIAPLCRSPIWMCLHQ